MSAASLVSVALNWCVAIKSIAMLAVPRLMSKMFTIVASGDSARLARLKRNMLIAALPDLAPGPLRPGHAHRASQLIEQILSFRIVLLTD